MAERVLSVRLRAITEGYERALDRAAKATDQFANRTDRITSWGKDAQQLGGKLTRGLTLPIVGLGTATLMAAGNFEAGMREVNALTGASAEELKLLEEQALAVGAATQFSAGQASEAMTQLVKAGLDVNQTYEALPGVMQLASAAGLDIASAADIATNVISGFSLEVSELAKVNDYLSQTANSSVSTVFELGEAFKYVGPVAAGVGMSLEETSAVFGLLANNGIRASMAGTSLRGAISALVAPTGQQAAMLQELGVSTTDAAGNMLPMVDIIEQLEQSGISAGEMLQLFGQRAGPAMQALLSSGSKSLRDYTQTMEESRGIAQDLADAKMGGLNGAILQLKGSLETLAITLGEAGLVGVFTSLGVGLTGFTNTIGSAPKPVLQFGMAIAGVAAASGPTIWALGKLAGTYKPVIGGIGKMVGALQGLQLQLHLARMSGLSTGAALGAMMGPQALVIAGVAALGFALYKAKQAGDQAAKSYTSTADAATQLADSAGIALSEIERLKDGTEGAVVTMDDFRRANDGALATLRKLTDINMQHDMLMEIGYEMVLRGASPEDAVDQVRKLAEAAGIEVPVNLTIANIGDFENAVAGVRARALRAMDYQAWSGPEDQLDRLIRGASAAERELDSIANTLANTFNADNIAGFAHALAEAEIAMDGNSDAINRMVDETLKKLDLDNISITNAKDLATMFDELTVANNGLTGAQIRQLQAIRTTAEDMTGGLIPANVSAAASVEALGFNTQEYASKVEAAEAVAAGLDVTIDDMGDGMDDAAASAEAFEKAMAGIQAQLSLATFEFDAAANAADAFARALDATSSKDNIMGASLGVGSAMRSLREGRLPKPQRGTEVEDATKRAAKAVDELGDAMRRTDPKMSQMDLQLGKLAAAADGFRRSIAGSTSFDNQIASALDLGSAFTDFRKTFRRLPAEIDLAAAAMGKYRPRQQEAIRNLLKMGEASTSYLASLLEQGRGEAFVRGEANRMRDEYAAMFRQLGMNDAQVQAYIKTLGLTPEQIETAIKVSGVEAARFEVESYLSLLQGRIPDHIAASVVASIESGDLAAASSKLAAWAKTNPARVEINPELGSDAKKRAGEQVEELFSLPQRFNALDAAFGRYSDGQMRALGVMQQLGSANKEMMRELVASGPGGFDKAREYAGEFRGELHKLLADYGIVGDAAKEYEELLGVADWQVESAITLAIEADATWRITTLMQLLQDLDQMEPEVMAQVTARIAEGDLQGALDIIEWRARGLNPTAAMQITTGAAEHMAGVFRDYQSRIPVIFPGQVELTAAQRAVESWRRDQQSRPLQISAQIVGGGGFGTPLRGEYLPPSRLLPGLAPPGVAGGGLMSGPGTGTSDSIPAWLSTGEFVIKEKSVRSFGIENLHHINDTGTLPGFAAGGPVDRRLVPGTTITAANLQAARSATAQRIDLSSESVRQLADALADHAGVTVEKIEAPSPERVPEKLVAAVTTARWLS